MVVLRAPRSVTGWVLPRLCPRELCRSRFRSEQLALPATSDTAPLAYSDLPVGPVPSEWGRD
jgi:hypothetical protein